MAATFNAATGTLTFVQGEDDTQAGISLAIAGEAFPRLTLTPQGTLLTGDGTLAPTDVLADFETRIAALEP